MQLPLLELYCLLHLQEVKSPYLEAGVNEMSAVPPGSSESCRTAEEQLCVDG